MMETLKSRKYPVEAVLTRQAGAKYLMNLFYHLDHDSFYVLPQDIETDSGLRWGNLANSSPLENEDEESVRVTFFRNPLSRFCDFYFDKIYGGAEGVWADWVRQMGPAFDVEAGEDMARHQANANVLLNLIETKIAAHGLYNLSDQIAPQAKVVLPAQDNGFIAIDYSLANVDLPPLFEPYIGNIRDVLHDLAMILPEKTLFDPFEFTKGSLAKRLREIYAIDFDFFEAMHYGTT